MIFQKYKFLKTVNMIGSKLIEIVRPQTPEEQNKNCLNCANMEDFIKNLQQEVKRLQVGINSTLSVCVKILFINIGSHK